MDIDMAMVVRAVGEEDARDGARTWGMGPVMIPWLADGRLWAAVPGGRDWLNVSLLARGGELDVSCGCRQRREYCTHSIAVMAYAAEYSGRLEAARAAEDAGIREAAKRASPAHKKTLVRAASEERFELRDGLHLMKLRPHGLPPRGLDYGRTLDLLYMAKSKDCFLEEFADVDFDVAVNIARRFEAAGDVSEAARIYESVVETIAKNTGIVDDSNAHYSTSLQDALKRLVGCMADANGRARKGLPAAERRGYISWLVRRVARNDPDFFTDDFAPALDAACASAEDGAWRRDLEAGP